MEGSYPPGLPPIPSHASTTTPTNAGRSTYEIIWSCIVTIFACTWIALHPNIQINQTSIQVTLFRIKLMAIALLTPELVILWAVRQWLASRELGRQYKAWGWTRTHAYFALMGGFLYKETEEDTGCILSPYHLETFVQSRRVDITEAEIMDKSKGDIVSKALALGQTSWLITQLLARVVQRLPITELELATVAFAFLNFATYFFWWNKPQNLACPLRVYGVPEESLTSSGGHSTPSLPLHFLSSDLSLPQNSNEPIETLSRPSLALHNPIQPVDIRTSIQPPARGEPDLPAPVHFGWTSVSSLESLPSHPSRQSSLFDLDVRSTASAISRQSQSQNPLSLRSVLQVIGSPKADSNPRFTYMQSFFGYFGSLRRYFSSRGSKIESQFRGWSPGTSLVGLRQFIRKCVAGVEKLAKYLRRYPYCDIIPALLMIIFRLPLTLLRTLQTIQGFFLRQFLWFIWSPGFNFGSHNDLLLSRADGMCYYAGELSQGDRYISFAVASGFAVVFGATHTLAWSFNFPSRAEQLLWRTAAGLVTGLPLYGFVQFTWYSLRHGGTYPTQMAIKLHAFSAFVYLLSRLILLVQMFALLRAAPPGVHQTISWTSILPHI